MQFSFLNQGVAIDIEAFSLGGVSLGTVTVDPPPPLLVDVSALFGDVPVESLDLTAIGSTLRVGGIDFTAVPEPASALLLAFGLVGLAARPRGGPRRRSSH